jgi:hypothetical protein
MKTRSTMLALLVLAFFGSSCTTIDRLNTEYEEETAHVTQMSPAERAEWEKQQHEDFMLEMKGYFDQSDGND